MAPCAACHLGARYQPPGHHVHHLDGTPHGQRILALMVPGRAGRGTISPCSTDLLATGHSFSAPGVPRWRPRHSWFRMSRRPVRPSAMRPLRNGCWPCPTWPALRSWAEARRSRTVLPGRPAGVPRSRGGPRRPCTFRRGASRNSCGIACLLRWPSPWHSSSSSSSVCGGAEGSLLDRRRDVTVDVVPRPALQTAGRPMAGTP
jgi:hypothetical protein